MASGSRPHTRRFPPALALLLLVVAIQAPAAQAAPEDPYENTVFRTWSDPDLDVLVVAGPDPLIGASFQRAFDAWEAGIAYWSPSLASQLQLHYHWSTSGTVPQGVKPDIVVVPQGFMAATFGGACIAAAPMAVGWGSFDRVTFHEFGHCLGLGHVWQSGIEYRPARDIMGGGDGAKCPSNLNVRTLENVFSGNTSTVTMSPSTYQQAPSC